MPREARKFNKKPRTRPIKTPVEKARRLKVQRARLVKLGMDAEVVEKMQPEEVRKLCLTPKKVEKMLAAKA
ncbi:MAG: hypothetical protein R6V06_08755 [Kiritimatiellia bacterium]